MGDRRVDINKEEKKFGQSPLYIAGLKGFIEIVRLMLKDERINLISTTKADRTDSGVTFKMGSIALDAARLSQTISKFSWEEDEEALKRVKGLGLVTNLLRDSLISKYDHDPIWMKMFQKGEIVVHEDLKKYRDKLFYMIKERSRIKTLK